MTCERRRFVEFAADDAGKPSVGKAQMVSVTTELRSKTAEPNLRLVHFPPRCSHFEAHTYAHTRTHTGTQAAKPAFSGNQWRLTQEEVRESEGWARKRKRRRRKAERIKPDGEL